MKYKFLAVFICIFLVFSAAIFVRPSSLFAQTPQTIIVTNDNDSGPGSLRQAIADANPGDMIGFDLSSYIIHPTTPLIFDKKLTICCNLTLSGDTDGDGVGNGRIMEVMPGADVNLISIFITLGISDNGGAILNQGTLILDGVDLNHNRAANSGGAVYNEGNLSLYTMQLGYNNAENGGAIYNTTSGRVYGLDVVFYNNSALNEGGAIDNFGDLDTNRVTFAFNSADLGAAIHNKGQFITY
ncbi:MAG: outer membrane adhesin like protein, partial [uncultured bacterium (gcode 4)]